jgi:hypothetical protein
MGRDVCRVLLEVLAESMTVWTDRPYVGQKAACGPTPDGKHQIAFLVSQSVTTWDMIYTGPGI